jgi:hypothetical protein
VSYAPQSSPALLRLPACLGLLWVAVVTPAGAQDEQPLAVPTELHREPEGTPLVTLPKGAPVEIGDTQGGWREVTVEGWITTSSTSPTRRDGYDLVVTPDKGENLRQSPNGVLLGRAREGTLLERVGQRGKWTQVRREGWVPRQAVAQGSTGQGRGPAPVAAAPDPAPKVAATLETAETLRETGLNSAPAGSAYGTLNSGIPARVIGRSGEWVRVQVDGWVRESDLKRSEAGTLVGISAEEIRAAPDRFVGKVLDWKLQLISVQTADELRGELPAGQPYLLTRGPLPEPGFVYVAIPYDRVGEFRALPPLTELVLRVTLRAPKSRYLDTPVTELVSVVSGMEGSR